MRNYVDAALRPHRGAVEAVLLGALYAIYELSRGNVDASWGAAQRHAATIVRVERDLGAFWEWDVQRWVQALPAVPTPLGVAYVSLHIVVTIAALVWVHRRHREHFALLRTAVVLSSGLALVVYAVYPTAPPRLAGLGFTDTVTRHTGVNLNSTFLGELYNPIAAVPSLHVGYALIVAGAIVTLARHRTAKFLGALYPVAMLFIVVATGNHFWLDAAAGAAVVAVAWLVSRALLAAEPATA